MLRVFVGIFIVAAGLTAQAENSLRVATFNIHWGNANLQDIGRAITESDADIVCVQESSQASERYLQHHFRDTYAHFVFKGHNGRYAEERFGFISKMPLSDIRYAPPVDGLFGTFFATVTHNTQAVKLVNVHLSPFVISRGSTFQQAIQAVSSVEAVHRKEIAFIQSKIDPGDPTLVCGDFNSLSTFAAPTQLITLGLIDSFAAVTDEPETQPTWRWPVGNLRIQFRIDYIFHTNHFTTVRSKVIPSKGSDHSLVVSEITLNETKNGQQNKEPTQ